MLHISCKPLFKPPQQKQWKNWRNLIKLILGSAAAARAFALCVIFSSLLCLSSSPPSTAIPFRLIHWAICAIASIFARFFASPRSGSLLWLCCCCVSILSALLFDLSVVLCETECPGQMESGIKEIGSNNVWFRFFMKTTAVLLGRRAAQSMYVCMLWENREEKDFQTENRTHNNIGDHGEWSLQGHCLMHVCVVYMLKRCNEHLQKSFVQRTLSKSENEPKRWCMCSDCVRVFEHVFVYLCPSLTTDCRWFEVAVPISLTLTYL